MMKSNFIVLRKTTNLSYHNPHFLHQVWGEGYDDLYILRVNISNLHRKLEPDPSRPTHIHT